MNDMIKLIWITLSWYWWCCTQTHAGKLKENHLDEYFHDRDVNYWAHVRCFCSKHGCIFIIKSNQIWFTPCDNCQHLAPNIPMGWQSQHSDVMHRVFQWIWCHSLTFAIPALAHDACMVRCLISHDDWIIRFYIWFYQRR